MSREISEDFSNLTSFIDKYDLKTLLNNREFLQILSQQHKKFFAYLTCVAEIDALAKDAAILPNISEKQLFFIIESCSDIGSALFVMTHGAYKASKMMLRSSIETFLKGFSLDELVDIDQEKSVYNIFDRVKALLFFEENSAKELFGLIHGEYKNLCQDAHTATDENMQHITALKYFPTFQLDEATDISNSLMRLVSSYITLLCLKYNNHFIRMHHRNKENVIENIPKKFRALVNGLV